MRHLLNTLYILTPELYLTLDGENVVAKNDGVEAGRFPLHGLEQIICFSYMGASPALMGKCAENGISLSFFSQSGRFLARSTGGVCGNVLLRRRQYALSATPAESLAVARNMILGKVYNARWVLERALRDHASSLHTDTIRTASAELQQSLAAIRTCENTATLRGLEGEAASTYYSVFNELILHPNKEFRFTSRNRHPPLDPINALLSLAYSVLANNCAASLESVGLDPYIGMMHTDRPGRKSLALDLMEEMRAVMADRFVLTCVNNRIFSADMFEKSESGAVLLNDKGRRKFFAAWKERRDTVLTHPFLKEKIPWGLVPYLQSLLLARYIRGDLDSYPPFLWK